MHAYVNTTQMHVCFVNGVRSYKGKYPENLKDLESVTDDS